MYWQEQADRNAPRVLWQKIFLAMEKMRMSEDATARLAVCRASMTIFLQLTELELANYLCTHFQRLCDTVTPEAPNTGSSSTPLDPHDDEDQPFTDAQIDEQLAVVMKARAQNHITVMQAFSGMQI